MNVNISQLAVVYLNATKKRTTENPELEIETNKSNNIWEVLPVDGNGSVFGPPRGSGSVFWVLLELSQAVLVVHTQTAGRLLRPVAKTRNDTIVTPS